MVRLGKRAEDRNADNKQRPIKVSMIDNESKMTIMRNLPKIKKTPSTSPYRKLSIAHDMSITEREQNKEKVNEAKSLNDSKKSGDDFKYVVRGPPWARKVVRVSAQPQED